jgi:hypothetical protein
MSKTSSLINSWKKSFEVVKDNFLFFTIIVFLETVVSSIASHYSVTPDDTIMLTSTLAEVFLSLVFMIFVVNRFYSSFCHLRFSVQKVFWDIPTYIYYELLFGLILIFSIVLLVFPAVIIFVLFSFVPIVAIILDDDEEGIFTKTKRIVMSDLLQYLLVLIPFVILSLIDLAFDKIINSLTTIDWVIFSLRYFLLFLGVICLGSVISYLISTERNLSQN